MKIPITKIGNSQGIIIPAHILKQLGFKGEVSLVVKEESLVIEKIRQPREGWAQAFKVASDDPEAFLGDGFMDDFDQGE